MKSRRHSDIMGCNGDILYCDSWNVMGHNYNGIIRLVAVTPQLAKAY